MAQSVGKDGDIKIGDVSLSLDNWSLTNTINTSDGTKYGDTTKVNIATLREWSVEAGGTLDMANAQQAALLAQFNGTGTQSNVDLRLYIDSAHYWQGSAVVTGAPVNSSVGDKVNVSYSFACAGDLSYT